MKLNMLFYLNYLVEHKILYFYEMNIYFFGANQNLLPLRHFFSINQTDSEILFGKLHTISS